MAAEDLAPGLLLAAPALTDPNFAKSVVLLARNDGEGSLGWVINGRELMTVHELLRSSDLIPPGITVPDAAPFKRCASVGGPVASTAAWMIYLRAKPLPGEMPIGDDIGVSGDLAALTSAIRNEGPLDFRLVVGCAGWGAGQLEAEINVGAWLPAPLDRGLIFDLPDADLWSEAYRRAIGAEPAVFTGRRGQA